MRTKIVVSFFVFILFLTFSAVALVKKTSADWSVDGGGNLVYQSQLVPSAGEVLGTVFAKDGESGGGSSGSSGGRVAEEKKDERKEEKKEENREEATGGPRIKAKDGKTEIIFGEGEKIKIRTKDGETRTDVYSGGVKVRFEQKDGRMIIKAENESDQEILLGEQELFKIEERLDKNIVKVATGSANSMVFARGNFAAKTHFPLSVDLATNALTVTTPAGSKTVTILPDAAVNNMLAANVIDRLGAAAITEAAKTGTLTGVSGVVDLAVRNNLPVYEILGLSDQKFLGFIPVSIPLKVVVSADTGELVATEKTPLNTLLDLISF